MKDHNKITFAKEYCLCRRIPYRMKGEQLVLGDYYHGHQVIYSVYNFTYKELVECIDRCVEYDTGTTFFKGINK